MSVAAFLIALPLAVWSMAALYALIDSAERAAALRALCVRVITLMLFVAAFGPVGHLPLLWAFGVVTVLHLSASLASRWFLSRRYQQRRGES